VSLLSAKVIAIDDKGGRISLSVKAEGVEIQDIALVKFGGDEYPVAVGGRVHLLEFSGADGEYVALPIRQALSTGTRIVQGPAVILAETVANAVALALKSDAQAIIDAIDGAVVVAGDGGASLKTSILAALIGFPVGTSKVTAE
jgi:hypothetical protein